MLAKALPLVALFAQLAACGGGGSSTASNVSPALTAATEQEVVIGGSVGDGPVINATVTVQSADGSVIRREKSDASANYTLRVRKNTLIYPLVAKAEGGTDLVTGSSPDFTMTSVATSSEVQRLNINPFTTLIVRTAHKMNGGLTAANVNTARTNIMRQLNFGLDTNLIQDIASVYVDGSNIAQIVKSSEGFGEMIRRTRDTLVGQGILANGDLVIDALAADIADGTLVGQGAAGTDKRLSAVAIVTVVDQLEGPHAADGSLLAAPDREQQELLRNYRQALALGTPDAIRKAGAEIGRRTRRSGERETRVTEVPPLSDADRRFNARVHPAALAAFDRLQRERRAGAGHTAELAAARAALLAAPSLLPRLAAAAAFLLAVVGGLAYAFWPEPPPTHRVRFVAPLGAVEVASARGPGELGDLVGTLDAAGKTRDLPEGSYELVLQHRRTVAFAVPERDVVAVFPAAQGNTGEQLVEALGFEGAGR